MNEKEWRSMVEKEMLSLFQVYGFSFEMWGEKAPPAMETYVIYKSKKGMLKFYYDVRNGEKNVKIQLPSRELSDVKCENWVYIQRASKNKKNKSREELYKRAMYIQSLPFEDLSWIRELLEEYLPDIFGEVEHQ